jgi:hypothetical protein
VRSALTDIVFHAIPQQEDIVRARGLVNAGRADADHEFNSRPELDRARVSADAAFVVNRYGVAMAYWRQLTHGSNSLRWNRKGSPLTKAAQQVFYSVCTSGEEFALFNMLLDCVTWEERPEVLALVACAKGKSLHQELTSLPSKPNSLPVLIGPPVFADPARGVELAAAYHPLTGAFGIGVAGENHAFYAELEQILVLYLGPTLDRLCMPIQVAAPGTSVADIAAAVGGTRRRGAAAGVVAGKAGVRRRRQARRPCRSPASRSWYDIYPRHPVWIHVSGNPARGCLGGPGNQRCRRKTFQGGPLYRSG